MVSEHARIICLNKEVRLRFRKQIGDGHAKGVGNSRDIAKRGITQPQFYTAEVGPVYAGLLRQFLLRQMFRLT